MALPQEILKPISEFNTPAVKLLMIILILANMAQWGLSYTVSSSAEKKEAEKSEIWKGRYMEEKALGHNTIVLKRDSALLKVDPAPADSSRNIATTGFVKRNRTDTASLSARINNRYDSLRRLPGSVILEGRKNNVWYNTGVVDSAGGAYIPLAGTAVGSPVMGNIEIGTAVEIYAGGLLNTNTNNRSLSINEDGVFLNNKNYGSGQEVKSFISVESTGIVTLGSLNATINKSILVDGLDNTKGIVVRDQIANKGLTGDADFTPNITDLDYTQKKYVDEKVALGAQPTFTIDLTSSSYAIAQPGIYEVTVASAVNSIFFPNPSLFNGSEITVVNTNTVNDALYNNSNTFAPLRQGESIILFSILRETMQTYKSINGKWRGK